MALLIIKTFRPRNSHVRSHRQWADAEKIANSSKRNQMKVRWVIEKSREKTKELIDNNQELLDKGWFQQNNGRISQNKGDFVNKKNKLLLRVTNRKAQSIVLWRRTAVFEAYFGPQKCMSRRSLVPPNMCEVLSNMDKGCIWEKDPYHGYAVSEFNFVGYLTEIYVILSIQFYWWRWWWW